MDRTSNLGDQRRTQVTFLPKSQVQSQSTEWHGVWHDELKHLMERRGWCIELWLCFLAFTQQRQNDTMKTTLISVDPDAQPP